MKVFRPGGGPPRVQRVLGSGIFLPGTPPAPTRPDPERSAGSSPLTSVFPGQETKRAYFVSVAGAALTVPSGQSAWFILRRIRFGDGAGGAIADMPQAALVGITAELWGTNPAAADTYGTGTSRAWGDVRGDGAAIVVARDLPFEDQTWSAWPAFIPGMETTGNSLINPARAAPDYIRVLRFAPGTIADSTPAVRPYNIRFLPALYRFPTGTLDIALVIRGSAIQAGNFQGKADIAVDLMPVRQPRNWEG